MSSTGAGSPAHASAQNQIDGSGVSTDPRSVATWLYSDAFFQNNAVGLDNVPMMAKPDNMIIEPEGYQLKGAAQIHYSCLGPFAGMILADPRGLGRRTQAALAIHLAKELPGKTLVVVPKVRIDHSTESAADQWLRKFDKIWEKGFGPKVFHLEDPKISASELHAGDWDVIICEYDFVKASYLKFLGGNEAVLHTTAGGNMVFKTVYLDNSHLVTDTGTIKHIALHKLHRRATVCLTPDPLPNMWTDIYGAINFLRGHPWTDEDKFTHTFGTGGTSWVPIAPSEASMQMLQRFLQAVIVIRPESVTV